MPPTLLAVLARLRQDLAACLRPEAIRDACRAEGHAWRHRRLDPVATVHLMLLQALHGNTACRHLVHLGGHGFTARAYGLARARLPLAVLHRLLGQVAEATRRATAASSDWLGHRVWVVDGSGFSMPDAPELRAAFGQPGNQAPGCGFPVAKWLALFDVATGMLLRSAAAPLRTHDLARAADVSEGLGPGDLVLGDRGFGSYALLALLTGRGLHAVTRAHQRRRVELAAGDVAPPRSRRVRARVTADGVAAWARPEAVPSWMTAEQFAALPAELAVRAIRYRVDAPGYRVREVTLTTTLLDRSAYPAEALAELYFRRWQVEVDLRDLKITMKMDVLHCRTEQGVLKELAAFALAYNLVRSAMWESARAQGVTPDRISLADAVRWLLSPAPGRDASVLLVNPSRRGRVEPRVVKRRPKQYQLMNRPRSELRKLLPRKGM